jgi:glycosyltransferase involved in cell wall biosynthesis
MISLNEAHNMAAVLENLKGFAAEVFLVDSYSSDDTVDIALAHGVHVVQRKFSGFGDQWNFAVGELPVTQAWTMKLDPDERLSDDLKRSIAQLIAADRADGFTLRLRLWFMGRPLPVIQTILRGWRTGNCRFSDVPVNEHPLVSGTIEATTGEMAHHDSPDLHHWFDKQNRYSSAEALVRIRNLPLAGQPKFFGSRLERRMWLKKNFFYFPMRYQLLFLYNLFAVRFWAAGSTGITWARMRVWVQRSIEDKVREMQLNGRETQLPAARTGAPHPQAEQRD